MLGWIVYIAIGYLILLNFVVTFRIIRDDEPIWRKVLFAILVWIVPFLGAFFISALLNTLPYEPKGRWRRHPFAMRIIAVLFMIRLSQQRAYEGYPSSMNDNGYYGDTWNGLCDGIDHGACDAGSM